METVSTSVTTDDFTELQLELNMHLSCVHTTQDRVWTEVELKQKQCCYNVIQTFRISPLQTYVNGS